MGTTARIDYVCSDVSTADACKSVSVPDTVDLSLTAGEDHRCVAVEFLEGRPSVCCDTAKKAVLNKWKLRDKNLLEKSDES